MTMLRKESPSAQLWILGRPRPKFGKGDMVFYEIGDDEYIDVKITGRRYDRAAGEYVYKIKYPTNPGSGDGLWEEYEVYESVLSK